MVDVNTTVFNKQLEELESLADSTGLYDDQSEDDEEEVQAEPSIEWRRASLEEAYSRVKRAKGRPVDPHKVYEIGTLLFEPAEGKFGRVKRSVPGYLCIHFLRGGEREYGRRPDVEAYLRDHHRGKTAAELAVQLGLTETEVQGHLNRLGLVRVDVIPGVEGDAAAAAAAEERKDKAAKAKAAKAATKDALPGVVDDDIPGAEPDAASAKGKGKGSNKSKLPSPVDEEEMALLKKPLPPKGKEIKGAAKKADAKTQAGKSTVAAKSSPGKTATPAKATQTPAKAKTVAPAAAKAKTTPPAKGKTTVPPAKGKTTPPAKAGPMSVEEANAFIKKNYKDLTNRDLAKRTGLSEHTVRRKLGEWSLKRPKE